MFIQVISWPTCGTITISYQLPTKNTISPIIKSRLNVVPYQPLIVSTDRTRLTIIPTDRHHIHYSVTICVKWTSLLCLEGRIYLFTDENLYGRPFPEKGKRNFCFSVSSRPGDTTWAALKPKKLFPDDYRRIIGNVRPWLGGQTFCSTTFYTPLLMVLF